ncbi:sulfatase-like hydrolase/transferase [Halobacteriovorax sp. DPLXC-1]|uniref:sulfatase-like hydrolase/transferase n=1 Tax=Halobacteriovorax sp. DPLXC-1 TaxID=3110771 RepID=UPI002FF13219
MSNIFIVSNYFTGVGLNDVVLYHLRLDTVEAGVGEYTNIIIASAVMIILSIFFTYKITKKKVASHFATVVLLLAIISSPLTHNLYTLLKPNEFQGIKIDIHKAGDEIAEIKDKKNLIIIYAEGFEKTYLNDEVFPGMTPNMRELEKQSLSFTNMYSNYGATWTIAGMVASQCGVPLEAAGEGNAMEGIFNFYGSAVCLPDILHSNGYIGAHLKGASVVFSGTKNYLKTHKYSLIKGKDDLKKKYPTARTNSWGFYDKNLFDEAKIVADNLAKKDNPFFLSVNTLDTHHPKGHVFPSCKINHQDGDSRLVKAFKCSDYYIKEFVDKIRASEYSDNTLIVVMSDHLSLRNLLSDKLQGMDRKNLFLINYPNNSKTGEVTKPGTHLDVATTLLAQLGTDYKVGLGVDLLKEEKTLYEQYGAKTDSYLKGMREEFLKLWSIKNLDKGIRVKDEFLYAGDNKFKIPLILYYDEKGKITPTYFLGKKKKIQYSRDLIRKSPNQAFTWIDYCDTFEEFFKTEAPSNEFCTISGKLSANLKIEPLDEGFHLSNDDIIDITKQKIDSKNFSNYRKLIDWNLNGPLKSLVESSKEGEIIQYTHLPKNFEQAFNRVSFKNTKTPDHFYRYISGKKQKPEIKINGNKYKATLVKNDTGLIKKIHNLLRKTLYVFTGRAYFPTVTGVQKLELIK